ncbi:dihydrolipoyl dehydrogenase family protein [Rhodovulum sp. DZ06]|uniref:dihydrolipoyl dehydrogenase family protein n=1 Tax=Rhodovulum sp. DZ06 TaxID=3425126 RepID=UPI003D34B7D9
MRDETMSDSTAPDAATPPSAPGPKVPRDRNGVLTPDLFVIGAGSGGLSVAAGAARLGASVLLAEGGEMGGDCLNTGCVPSKALIAAAGRAHAMKGGLGVSPAEAWIDWRAVRAHVSGVIAAIAPHDSQERFEGLGVEVIRDWATFRDKGTLECGGHVIRPRRVVIATGSAPAIPPVEGLADTPHLTNETIFAEEGMLPRLLVIGGGPIGLEMAQAHARLHCDVTVVEAGRALGREDPELAAIAIARLRAEGVKIREGAAVARAGGTPGDVWLELESGERLTGTHLLVAAGRRPALDRLGLDKAGVEATPMGVKVDAGLRSVSNRKVYAVGDAAGMAQFTHAAGWHAGLVVRSALFRLPVKADAPIPRVTYTAPEIAQAGLTEAEAREAHGDKVEVLRAEFSGNDRAMAMGAAEGMLKVMVVKGRPVGASMVGPQAGELIQLWQLAISKRLKIGDIAGMIAPYPTLSEISKRAAGSYYEDRLFANPWVKRAVKLLARLG